MAGVIDFKYRAFLSYAHADMRWGKWLHGQLEGFRIDRDLAGRTTPHGPVPKSLRPIFRDREDFSGGHTLTDATVAALDASAALIVLCSRISATRPAVNEEVRLFRWRHPERPVIPVIIDGTFPDNFPPALRFEIAADGSITDRPVTILGPDLRDTGDGKALALAKVAAPLLGVAPDDVFRRAERQRRRSANFRNAVIAVLMLTTVGALAGAYFFREELKRNEALLDRTLERATTLVNKAVQLSESFGVPRTVSVGFLEEAEGMFKDMAELGSESPKLLLRKAQMLVEFARSYEILGRSDEHRRRAAEAERIMGRLADRDPANQEAQRQRSVALDDLGDAQFNQGNLTQALGSFTAGLAIAERLARADPSNAGWQRDLSVSHIKIGDVQRAQGNLPAARDAYTAALAIRDRLARADPGNAGWQRDLSVSHNKIGDVLVEQGNLPAALDAFNASHAIFERLARADPGNGGWQRDLAISYERRGAVALQQGDTDAARRAFESALGTYEGLVARNLGDVQSLLFSVAPHWQLSQLDPAKAAAHLRAALGILKPLAEAGRLDAGRRTLIAPMEAELAKLGE